MGVLIGAAIIIGLVVLCCWAGSGGETSGKAWYRDWGG